MYTHTSSSPVGGGGLREGLTDKRAARSQGQRDEYDGPFHSLRLLFVEFSLTFPACWGKGPQPRWNESGECEAFGVPHSIENFLKRSIPFR